MKKNLSASAEPDLAALKDVSWRNSHSRNPELETRNPKSEIRNPKPEIRNSSIQITRIQPNADEFSGKPASVREAGPGSVKRRELEKFLQSQPETRDSKPGTRNPK